MNEGKQLNALRERIDALDKQLLALLNERARFAQQIAEAKQAEGGDGDCYRPEREAGVLRSMQELNTGPLSNEEVARLFREVMSACLALEQPLQIGYLGPAGTFTQVAAQKQFGHSVQTLSLVDIAAVFREVESGSVQFGVVPIENSSEGMIHHTLDMFLQSSLRICGEVELRIHHHLLSVGKDLDAIEKVYAHPQALAQCRCWLDAHLPHAKRIDVSSNAEGARIVVDDPAAAAIAGDAAAEIYRLNQLGSNIEDEQENTTRFLVVGRQEVGPSGKDKTSMLVSVQNQPGALYRILEPFGRHNISMTRIESRPSRRAAWDYVFFVDIEGHVQDQSVVSALEELRQQASLVKVLGSYPVAPVS